LQLFLNKRVREKQKW